MSPSKNRNSEISNYHSLSEAHLLILPANIGAVLTINAFHLCLISVSQFFPKGAMRRLSSVFCLFLKKYFYLDVLIYL